MNDKSINFFDININEIESLGIKLNPNDFDFIYGYPALNKLQLINDNLNTDFLVDKNPIGIYIHIPFCMQHCSFCYFKKTLYNEEHITHYLNAIFNEIDIYSQHYKTSKIKYIYIGGGTPSILSPKQIELLSKKIFSVFNVCDDYEFTFEASPDSLDENKIHSLINNKINRLSIGVQSFDDDILNDMNRSHSSIIAKRTIDLAKKYFFDSLNIDLIFGYPKSNEIHLKKDIKVIEELDVPSITYYQMWTRVNTKKSFKENELNKENIIKYKVLINNKLLSFGYYRDKSDWFIKSEKSKYKFQNHKWKNYPFIGIGVSSYAYINGVYYRNTVSINEYIERTSRNKLSLNHIFYLSDDEKIMRNIVLRIKLDEGFPVSFLNDFSSSKTKDEVRFKLNKLINNGLVCRINDSIKLTNKGFLFPDNISQFLMSNIDQKYYDKFIKY